ncbi:MAG TPA: hypothetical protein VHR88_01185 [Solirubrobacteraceae bacterium]|nr:hypothetical protein [Solirubrobacteraceae bacterium]
MRLVEVVIRRGGAGVAPLAATPALRVAAILVGGGGLLSLAWVASRSARSPTAVAS